MTDEIPPPAPAPEAPSKPKLVLYASAAGAAGLLLVVLAFALGHSCAGCNQPSPLPDDGIDAGPGLAEIDERERQAQEEARRRLEEIEREHQAELEAFDERQREKYEHVREMGPDAVAEWLTEFNRSLHDSDLHPEVRQ